MSSDDSTQGQPQAASQAWVTAPGPPRARSGLRSMLLVALATFLLGIAATALFVRQYRNWLPRSAQAMIDPGTGTGGDTGSGGPVGSGFEPPPEAGSASRSLDREQLDARQTALAGQLAALEARATTIDQNARAAAGNAGRAEALLIAFAARRAIDRGLALGYVEPQLRLRFGAGQPRAVASIIQAARAPVTIEDLRQGLDQLAPELASGAATNGWFTSLRREIAGLIVIRREGTPSPRAADRLVRVRRLIDAGWIEAALAEVGRLPGAPQAESWMDAAGRYIQTHAALDAIETAAIIGQGIDLAADGDKAPPQSAPIPVSAPPASAPPISSPISPAQTSPAAAASR